MKFIVAQSFKSLSMYVVHFGLIQNEPKDQGGESLVGGLFIDAAPFEWSIKFIGCNQRFWPVTNAAKASLKTPFSRQPIQGRVNPDQEIKP
jgi:hypothetical protein